MRAVELSLDEIVKPERLVRGGLDQNRLRELKESIERYGIIEPVVVRPRGERFELISGARRIAAAEWAGLTSVPAVVREADTDEAELLKLEENIQREDVDPVAQGGWFAYLHNQRGMTYDQIAQSIGRSKGYVIQRVELLTKDQAVRKAVEDGRIAFSVAREILAINPVQARRRYLEAAIKGGANAATIRKWRADHEGERGPGGDAEEQGPRESKGDRLLGSPSDRTPEPGPRTSNSREYVPTVTECFLCRQERENEQLEYKAVCRRCRDMVEGERE